MTSEQSVTAASVGDIVPDIQATLNAVVQACHAKSRSDLAVRLQEEVQAERRQLPSVVVVGEANRGKSSLINALIGQVDLSPVDVDIATGATLVFHWSENTVVRVDTGAAAGSDGAAGAAPRVIEDLPEIPADELDEWATVAGNPDNERGVRSVFVGVNSPLLRDLLLIDTPGVGGLDGGHSRLAVEAAREADALVMVTDGVLAAAEIDFVGQVSERVQNVLVPLTKADLLPEPDRARVLDANAAILRDAEQDLTGCTLVPVSALVANRALRSDPPRTDLLDESGVPHLADLLRAAVGGRAQAVRLANVVRLARSAMAVLQAAEREQIAALQADDPRAIATLEAEQRQLDELLSARAEWSGRLDEGLRLVGLTRADELRAGMREVTMRYEEKSFAATGEQLSALPAQVLADVSALTTRIAAATAERIGAVVDDIGLSLQAAADSFDSVERLRSGETGEFTLSLPTQRSTSRVENMSTLVSLSSGRSLGSLVAGLPVFALAGAPFVIAGLGVGAVFAWQMHRGRGETNRQQQFRSWLGHQISEAQSQLSTDYERAMMEVRKELRQAVSRWLEMRRTAVAAALETHQAGLQRSRAERENQLQNAQRDLVRLEDLLAKTGQLSDRLAILSTAGAGA